MCVCVYERERERERKREILWCGEGEGGGGRGEEVPGPNKLIEFNPKLLKLLFHDSCLLFLMFRWKFKVQHLFYLKPEKLVTSIDLLIP